MNIATLSSLLGGHAGKPLAVLLPDGDPIPAHFHVTEVGRVTKEFIDCGGTVRRAASCRLQVWVGPDVGHRLSAGRLASILELARPVLRGDDLEVEVEHEGCALAVYGVADAQADGERVVVSLSARHADCLAKEACGIAEPACCAGGCQGEGP